MAFDHDAWLAENLDAHGDLAPPWARYPEIPAGSIGWRMGGGEGWLVAWHRWVPTLPADPETRLAYLGRHPPAPRTWLRSASWVLDPTLRDADEESGEAAARRESAAATLEREGLVADDAGILAWLARNESPEPPWVAHRSPAEAVRYGARELGFFVRWAAGSRRDGRLEAWLAGVGPAPPAWGAFVDALRGGVVPSPLPDEPREQLAVLLAATGGRPPLPWTRDESPSAMEEQFEEPTTHAGAWAEWAMEAFDEPSTFAAYLEGGPPLPEAWRAAVADAVGWLL